MRKSLAELKDNVEVNRILLPSRKRKANLRKAGNVMTIDCSYSQYEILRECSESGQDIMLSIKLRGAPEAKAKMFSGKVLLIIK